MAAMGYAYLVRTNIYEEGGAYAFIRDLLVHLRKPDGAFDATMLLVDWDDATRTLGIVEDPAEELSMGRFFADLVHAVLDNTPVEQHKGVRLKRLGGGTRGADSQPKSDGCAGQRRSAGRSGAPGCAATSTAEGSLGLRGLPAIGGDSR